MQTEPDQPRDPEEPEERDRRSWTLDVWDWIEIVVWGPRLVWGVLVWVWSLMAE